MVAFYIVKKEVFNFAELPRFFHSKVLQLVYLNQDKIITEINHSLHEKLNINLISIPGWTISIAKQAAPSAENAKLWSLPFILSNSAEGLVNLEVVIWTLMCRIECLNAVLV